MPTCSLAVTIFCSRSRFCPAAGIVRDRRECPGHLVGICEQRSAAIIRDPLGHGVQHACGDHLLELAGRHPGWTVIPYDRAAGHLTAREPATVAGST